MGDRNVQIKLGDLDRWKRTRPFLVDDIVSSGRTMLEAIRLLQAEGWATPARVAVHGLFADGADVLLAQAGARVVTTSSVVHPTNGIDLSAILGVEIADLHQA